VPKIWSIKCYIPVPSVTRYMNYMQLKQTSKHPPEWIFSNLAESASLNQFLDRERVYSARELYMLELREKLWSVLCCPLCLNVVCKTYW